MRHLGNNGFAKMILFVCVIMQAVALMPHHHHGENVAVCLDYGHIYTADSCDSICTEGHSHGDQPYSMCSSHSIVMMQPQFRDNCMEATSSDHLPDNCPCCAAELAQYTADNRVSVILTGLMEGHEPEPYLRIYLTAAVPCRAPDVVC